MLEISKALKENMEKKNIKNKIVKKKNPRHEWHNT